MKGPKKGQPYRLRDMACAFFKEQNDLSVPSSLSLSVALPSCSLDLDAYRDLVHHACGLQRRKAVAEQVRALGIDADAWQAVMADPGRFQSAAVGGLATRQALAEVCGRKWIADKTPIWLTEPQAE